MYCNCLSGVELRHRVELFLDQDVDDVEEIIVDLWRHNNRKEVYTRFYETLSVYLAAEESKVDQRRHQGLSQIPTAWSYSNLRKNLMEFQAERAAQDLEAHGPAFAESEVPSTQWPRLLFCPSNPWLESSRLYKCKFELSSELMSRSADHDHVDSEYPFFVTWLVRC